MTHMCQKCAATLGNTELMYTPTINTEDEDFYSREEEEIKNWTKHSLRLNIRSTSTSPVHKKQRTSYARGKK